MSERWKGYYLTAYGIAVKHGFKGTEEEWLKSLKGEKGEPLKFSELTKEQKAQLIPQVDVERVDKGYKTTIGDKVVVLRDGSSPEITSVRIENGTEILITNPVGEDQTFTIEDGYSPTVSVTPDAEGTTVWIEDKNGSHFFTIKNGVFTNEDVQRVIDALPNADEVLY